jgi:hypothetical protein
VPGARGLVGGVAVAASQPRVGHWWRTFGSRASGRRRLGEWANARKGAVQASNEADGSLICRAKDK